MPSSATPTLSLVSSPENLKTTSSATPQQTSSSVGQPTRTAPPPPISRVKKTISSPQIDTPLNVSVNVTVSPVSSDSTAPPLCTVRHTSALTVQPELWPFQTDLPIDVNNTNTTYVSTPMRSFTSVQFKLRPPVVATNETSL